MSESALDIERLRRETPGTQEVIHLNNAGAALMPQPVVDAVIAHLQLEARIGGYEAADAAAERVEGVYASAARLIGAEPDEIAVVENATRAWDMAFYSIPFRPGDRILTSRSEYASNVISFLQVARQRGVSVEVIPSDESGQVDVVALERMLDARVKLIAISHVPTNGGLVQPAAEIGRVARQAGVLYLLDACQSVGQLPVDVGALGCDLLSATSRKYLRGPRGVGFLYARRGIVAQLEPPLLDLHAARWVAPDRYEIRPDARRFENWETNYAAKLGMGAAIEYALGVGIESGWQRLRGLAEQLRAQLAEIPGVQVHDLGRVRGGIVTFSREGVDSEEIKRRLAAERINVTTSSIFSTRYDMSARNLGTMVRASTHYYNTEDELARLLDVVEGLT
ncbi:MAG TPA: aminotransferase class V-fold PLP-dependent enzyme [Thermomicrobiaceae bacterium]|nr:aminotransferase class V-fold PLP-dependent enzyme [Thermomicrobiaceae bacterium]